MATITIQVQSLLNAGLFDSYTVSDTITVSTLKGLIYTATNVDAAWYNLSYDREVLSDLNTLASYGIVNGSILYSGNIIGYLPTLEDRQVAKLDLATLDRTYVGNPYNVYDINLLPSKYVGNVSTPNSHPDGLLQGRPWIIPIPSVYLDASIIDSYPLSGNVWYDLSNNSYDATLINNPTFINYPARFNFNPDDSEWAEIPDIGDLNTWSIESWFKLSSTLTGQITAVVCNEFDLATSLNFSMGTNLAPGSYNLAIGFFDGTWHSTTGFSPAVDTWYHCVGTYDGTTINQYVNGTLNSSLTYSGTPTSGGNIRIASRWDTQVSPTDFFPGDIGLIRIYDTALTADQVMLNYQQTSPAYI